MAGRRADQGFTTQGFTLIEVMMTTAIMAVAMGGALLLVDTASKETAIGTAEAVVQNAVNTFAEKLTLELRNARRSSVTYPDGTSIRFQVPVDPDGDGSVFNTTTQVFEYGATLGMLHTAGGYIEYRFQANQVGGVDDELNEADVGVDINIDGDQTDVFKRGFFTRAAPDTGGTSLARGISDRSFIVGDWDGDGIDDPVFQPGPSTGTVSINLRAVHLVGRERTPVRAQVSTAVWLRN